MNFLIARYQKLFTIPGNKVLSVDLCGHPWTYQPCQHTGHD